MAENIGHLIKKVAEGQGLSQSELGQKLRKSKQGVASIYKRDTIDTELLIEICEVLNFDFLAFYYTRPPLSSFKQKEIEEWESKVSVLVNEIEYKDRLLLKNDELLDLQRKYITELEAKIKRHEAGNNP